MTKNLITKTATEQRVRGRPFPPGVSGNPKGRPKKEFSIKRALEKILKMKDPKEKIENYKLLLLKAVEKAKNGDNDMIKYLINRIEGMPAGSTPVVKIDQRNLEVRPILAGYSRVCPKCGYHFGEELEKALTEQKTDI